MYFERDQLRELASLLVFTYCRKCLLVSRPSFFVGRMECCVISKDMSAKGYVYTLALEGDCYYVGFSTNPEVRISSHFLGRGAQWTRLHPPVSVISIQPGDVLMERTVTLACMIRCGFQKVRGGPWLALQLMAPPEPILKAYALKPPPPLPDYVEPEIVKGHTLIIQNLNGPNAWRARIAGHKATKECPKRGFKTLYGGTESELRMAVEAWFGEEGGEHDSEVESAKSGGEDES